MSHSDGKRPARMSGRVQQDGVFEDSAFAKARDKRRQRRDLAKAARRKQRR